MFFVLSVFSSSILIQMCCRRVFLNYTNKVQVNLNTKFYNIFFFIFLQIVEIIGGNMGIMPEGVISSASRRASQRRLKHLS